MLRDAHVWGAWAVVAANLVVGAWALLAVRVPALRSRALWPATAAAEVGMFVEVALGVALVAGEDRQAARLHPFYGFVALAAIGILFSYRSQLRDRLHLLYGLGGLFLMGLALRAVVLQG